MKKKQFIILLSALGLLFFFTAPILALAQTQISVSTAIPGNTPNATSSPGAFIANFYQFALIIGGVLAFGVIIYGGVRYMTSAGNPSGASDAKEWIEAALLGLLLLAGAYFILSVVNPQLLNLTLPTLQGAGIQAVSGGSGSPSTIQSSNDNTACGPNNPSGVCPTGQTCNNVPSLGGPVCQTTK